MCRGTPNQRLAMPQPARQSARASGRADYRAMWNALGRLGHRDEMEAWMQAGQPHLGAPTVPLRRLGDWDLWCVTPG